MPPGAMAYPDTSPTASSDPRVVRIDVQGSGAGENFMLAPDAQPVPTSGWPVWAEQERIGRRSSSWFMGAGAWRQDVPLMIEAWDGGDRLSLARRQMEVLRQLTQTPDEGKAPPLATLTGDALWRQGKDWAFVGYSQTERIHATGDDPNRQTHRGNLLRMTFVVSFQQVLVAEALNLLHAANPGFKLHVVKKGETLRTIAVAELASEKRWREIRYATGKEITDPGKIKQGDRLRIPPKGSA